jgi:hypothetical protein
VTVTPAMLERLRREDQAELERLRTVLLPQRVGMAIGSRMLSDEVTDYVAERVQELRWDSLVEQRVGKEAAEDTLALVRDEMALILHRLRSRSSEWSRSSMQIEGEVRALEKRIARLDALLADPDAGDADATPADDTSEEL